MYQPLGFEKESDKKGYTFLTPNPTVFGQKREGPIEKFRFLLFLSVSHQDTQSEWVIWIETLTIYFLFFVKSLNPKGLGFCSLLAGVELGFTGSGVNYLLSHMIFFFLTLQLKE